MKLLYVLHQFFPRFHTGTEQYALGLARAARAAGDEVAFFTLEPDFEMGAPGVRFTSDAHQDFRVHRISLARALFSNPVLAEYESPLAERWFAQVLAQEQPDVVHFFHLRYLGAGLLDQARAAGVAHLLHLMDFWFLCAHVTLLKPEGALCLGPEAPDAHCFSCAYRDLHRHATSAVPALADGPLPDYDRSLLRHTDFLGDLVLAARLRTAHLRTSLSRVPLALAPSQFLADRFRDNGYGARRMEVVGYGIDPERLAGLGARRDRPLTFGYMGSIQHHKGLHVLIEAFRATPGEHCRLTIHGREEDYPDYARDRRYQAAGDARIAFHGAFRTEDLGRVLDGIDVLVVPSLWFENTPFVMLEALYAGRPVIASDLGGLSELLAGGRGGETFAAGDAKALARVLGRLSQNPGEVGRWRGTMPAVKTLAQNYAEIRSRYESLRAEKHTMAETEPRSGAAESKRLEEALALKDRQIRDLYDMLAELAARLLRQK